MCYFGPPPCAVIISGSVTPTKVHEKSYHLVWGWPKPRDNNPLESGIYHIAASGSFYAYYDGDQFQMNVLVYPSESTGCSHH